jgi:tetratricopeptide (TPR) repeat protein
LADIFVSYSRRDRKRVAPLVALLQEQGWTVWWDSEINPGESFDELIDEEIEKARAIVVVWSKHSVTSRWVRNEALEAADREILVPVRLDGSRIPVAFRQTQVADLTRWPGHASTAEMSQLLRAIGERIGTGPDLQALPQETVGRQRKLSLAIIGAILVAMLGAGALFWREAALAPQTTETNAVAVLRLATSIDSDTTNFAADSLGDEITRVLENVDGIRLANLTAAWELPYDLTESEIAARLNVRYLVQGAVDAKADDAVALQIRLYDTVDERPLFEDTYEYQPSRIQTLRRQIVAEILAALGLSQTRIEAALDSASAIRDDAAYQRYLRARAILRQSGELNELAAARDLLIQAVQQDPGFGAAHAALCRAYLGIFRVGGDLKSFERAEGACHRALTLGDGDAEAQLALGDLYELSGQYERAEASYERALDLDPLLTDALSGLGYALTMQGKSRRAERAYRRSTEIQPGYWRTHNRLAWFLLQQGRYQEAVDSYTQVIFLVPDNPWGYSNRGAALFVSGDFSGAIKDWQRATDIDPESGALSNMGTAYFYLRDFSNSIRLYGAALQQAPTDFRLWMNLGDALRFVEEEGPIDYPSLIPVGDAASAYQRAIRHIRAELTVNPDDAFVISAEARAQAYIGQTARAELLVNQALEASQNNPDLLYNVTLAYLSMEMIEQAARTLQAAIDAGLPPVIAENDPLFDALRESHAIDQLPASF